MEKLKKSIVKTHEDIDEEKEKNIELLNMIFPSDIARKLWGGKMLFVFYFLTQPNNLFTKQTFK